MQEEPCRWSTAMPQLSDRPDRTVVAGQSFGGLAAMFAAFNRPQRWLRAQPVRLLPVAAP
ncbi:alpha/beta hydrolase-fold protein [Klebsiella pneumoniae]|nr:alpha/beta hydrolase-fold protein [Klebsiella pneumoniae]